MHDQAASKGSPTMEGSLKRLNNRAFLACLLLLEYFFDPVLGLPQSVGKLRIRPIFDKIFLLSIVHYQLVIYSHFLRKSSKNDYEIVKRRHTMTETFSQ